jgi:hypothetical protein
MLNLEKGSGTKSEMRPGKNKWKIIDKGNRRKRSQTLKEDICWLFSYMLFIL